MSTFSFSRLIMAALVCASLAVVSGPVSGFAAEETTKAAPAKAAPKKAAPKKTKKPVINQNEIETEGVVQSKLEKFAAEKLDSFNRTTLRSEKKKHVSKNPDGTYTASYTHFDKNSIRCFYKDTVDPKTGVRYIGNFSYMQVEYQCTAPTEKQALAGPFVKRHQESITELAKYKKGQWSY